MTTAGIILLCIGAAVFILSFFIPDKGDRESKQDIENKREQIRRLLDSEIDGMKLRVNEATNESVEFGMEKSERALEKITNDKIMAVNEYATTILDEIDRNHKEVLFLYDMLNDKQTDVKNTVRHAEAAVREAEDAAKAASDTAMYAVNVAETVNEAVTGAAESQIVSQPVFNTTASNMQTGNVGQTGYAQNSFIANIEPAEKVQVSAPTESVFGMAAREDFSDLMQQVVAPVPVREPEPEPEPELTEFEMLERTTSFSNVSNNNQMILKLNAQGVPVVDIARQLSLGVGEVQLVIDLFK